MLKGRILGIFCWICLFSECFLSIRDGVWLWAFACRMVVGFACRKVVSFACWMVVSLLVGRCELCLLDGCELACRKVVDFTCRKVVGFCLFLSLFLRDLVCWRVNIVCSKRESSLLEKRKQSARKEKVTSRNRL